MRVRETDRPTDRPRRAAPCRADPRRVSVVMYRRFARLPLSLTPSLLPLLSFSLSFAALKGTCPRVPAVPNKRLFFLSFSFSLSLSLSLARAHTVPLVLPYAVVFLSLPPSSRGRSAADARASQRYMRRSERFKPAADLTRARASARYDGILAARSPVNNRNGLGFQNALSRTPPVICVARLYRSTSRLSLIGLSRSIPRGGRREKRYVPCVYERYGPMCSSLSPSEHVMRYSVNIAHYKKLSP